MKTTQILDPAQLQNQIEILRVENLDLHNTVAYLTQQLDWFKRQIFGKKSERIISDLNGEQLLLEGLDAKDLQSKEETQTVPAHQRRKPKRNGQDAITLDPNLPVKTIVLDVPEEQKVCQETGTPLVKIGEEVTHKLAHEPGSYYIKETIRPKYAHPQKPEDGVLTALLPDSILSKCQADDSLLAEIVTQNLLIISLFAIASPKYWVVKGLASAVSFSPNG